MEAPMAIVQDGSTTFVASPNSLHLTFPTFLLKFVIFFFYVILLLHDSWLENNLCFFVKA
jgi:hypothetical protein